MGWFSTPRRKNTKGARLRKLQSKIRKEEKRVKLNSDLAAAERKLETLRRRR